MVELAASHGPPFLVILVLWFLSTGLIAWAGNRDRRTFRSSLTGAAGAGAIGLLLIAAGAGSTTPLAAYASVTGAIAVWGWHELSFLAGAITGPRRSPCPPGAAGLARFRAATACVIHHEVALALTAVLLLALGWAAPNPWGAWAFALLFVLRLSAKLNLFLGAAAFSDELLPAHLGYLKTYFGRRRLHAALPISIVAGGILTAALVGRALAAPAASGSAAGYALLAGLAALGTLEHIFMALPVRDGALWRWAIAQRTQPGHDTAEALTHGL